MSILRAAVPVVSGGPVPSLTPREYEVLRIYATTGIQKAVASRLGLSRQTVKNHCRSAYIKLDVDSAIGAFTKLGWLCLPDEPTPDEGRYEWRLVDTRS